MNFFKSIFFVSMFILSNQLLSQSLVGLTSKEITDSQFNQFYAESISRNYSREQIANMAIGMGLSTTERDNFMSAEESKDYGLVDQVLDKRI